MIIQKDVEQLEAEGEEMAEEDSNMEANDLRDYNGVDGDGVYYEEDRDDDFMED